MLSLLHGPVDIVPADPLEPAPMQVDSHKAVWIERLGIVVSSYIERSNTYDLNLYAIQMNGHAIRIGKRDPMSGFGVDTSGQFVLHWGASDPDKWDRLHLPSTMFAGTGGRGSARSSFGIMPDRRIYFSGYRIFTEPLVNLEIGNSVEYTFSNVGSQWGSSSMISYAGEINAHYLWWCFDCGYGKIYLYDATDKIEVAGKRTTFGSAVRWATYSRKHDVFAVCRRDTGRTPNVDQLYLYANEPAASTISIPALGSSPRRGALIDVSSTVLGDANEPCSGRHVRFDVTIGEVRPAVVETDATGKATSIFHAPFAAANDITVTATLQE